MPEPSSTIRTGENTIAVEVNFHIPTKSRKVDTETVDIHAIDSEGKTNKAMLSLKKNIFESPEYDAIVQFDRGVKRYLRLKALPSFLRASYYLIHVQKVEEIDAYLTGALAQRELLVEAFMKVYLAQKDAAQPELGPLWNDEDYKSYKQMEAAFSMTVRYASFSTPTALKSISKVIYDREAKLADELYREAMQSIDTMLCIEAQALVDHMVDRLTPGADGKPKVFQKTLVENMREFLDNFPTRNINDHRELAALVDQARGLLLGIDAETIKKSSDLKAGLAAGFGEIKARMDELVMNRPARKISFDESAA